MLTYLLAVLAAAANATSSVLQRKANREVPRKQNLSLRLIWSLLRRPVWLGGVLAVIAGFLLQAAALDNGQLAVVQPILVLELPMTLILAARVFGSKMRSLEWGSALAMTAGLAGLLYFLSPSAGRSASVHWYVWVIGIGANLALVGVMVAWGRRGPAGSGTAGGTSSAQQAAVLGVGAGAAFGLTAALMKGAVENLGHGIGGLLTGWQVYAMIAAGVLAMFLLQSAMNAGRLLAAQPGLTLSDPVVSIVWGVLAFQERVRSGWFLVLAVTSGLVIAGAVLALARSPLLSGESARTEEGQRDSRDDAAEPERRPRNPPRLHPDGTPADPKALDRPRRIEP